MKKVISVLVILSLLVVMFAGCSASNDDLSSVSSDADSMAQSVAEEVSGIVEANSGESYSAGFVTFGLGGDFFQQLADAFVVKMTAAGWKADYADGKVDPTAQIEAVENYIAMGVDAIVIWAVAPEAMTSVVEQAMNQGIKVIAFVGRLEKYDVQMVADNTDLAVSCNMLSAKWIDTIFADAEDNSVPVAVFTDRTAETGVEQGDVLLQIEQYSKKAKFVIEVECSAEDVDTGMSRAETLYTSNPEIKVFLTAHNGLALGINNYFTSISSPVTDYNDMGIFTINGDNAVAEIIKTSASDQSPLRGMVLTGSVSQTADEITKAILGAMDGSINSGHTQNASTTFVDANTIDEYLSTGTVTSVTKEDYKQ